MRLWRSTLRKAEFRLRPKQTARKSFGLQQLAYVLAIPHWLNRPRIPLQEVFLNRAWLLESGLLRTRLLVSEVMTTLTAAKKTELADFFTVRTVRGSGKRTGLCSLLLRSPHF